VPADAVLARPTDRWLLCTKSYTPDRKSFAISKDAEQRYGGQAGRDQCFE
jgi:hypothetical protein